MRKNLLSSPYFLRSLIISRRIKIRAPIAMVIVSINSFVSLNFPPPSKFLSVHPPGFILLLWAFSTDRSAAFRAHEFFNVYSEIDPEFCSTSKADCKSMWDSLVKNHIFTHFPPVS